MANKTFAELMESMQADLTNKVIVEKANPTEEKHYLVLLEKSYADFLSVFDKYMNSAIVAKHSDVKKLHEKMTLLKEEFNQIDELLKIKTLNG